MIDLDLILKPWCSISFKVQVPFLTLVCPQKSPLPAFIVSLPSMFHFPSDSILFDYWAFILAYFLSQMSITVLSPCKFRSSFRSYVCCHFSKANVLNTIATYCDSTVRLGILYLSSLILLHLISLVCCSCDW